MAKQWFYGTREGKWYLADVSEVPEYKRREGITQATMRKIGRRKAKTMALAPSFVAGRLF
jgi:hypothetical protein